MKKVRAFAGFIAILGLVAMLTVSFFLYRKVAAELLPWWAIAAGFQLLSITLIQLTRGSDE